MIVMIDKNRFKEVSLVEIKDQNPLPGNIYYKDIELSEKELKLILEEMSKYAFKCKHKYSYINWEHSECDEEYTDNSSDSLVDIKDIYDPLFLIKDKAFYGISVVTSDTSRATFLANGESFGRTEVHESESYGHVDQDDDYYYSMTKMKL